MIDAVVLLADAVARADGGEPAPSIPIGWHDLESMWMTDLLDVGVATVIDEDLDAQRRHRTTAVLNVSGRDYLVEAVEPRDDDCGGPRATIMASGRS